MASTTIQVREIHCQACENTIRTALSRLDGVRNITPSATRNDVRVAFDQAKVDERRLREALSEIGYEPVS